MNQTLSALCDTNWYGSRLLNCYEYEMTTYVRVCVITHNLKPMLFLRTFSELVVVTKVANGYDVRC